MARRRCALLLLLVAGALLVAADDVDITCPVVAGAGTGPSAVLGRFVVSATVDAGFNTQCVAFASDQRLCPAMHTTADNSRLSAPTVRVRVTAWSCTSLQVAPVNWLQASGAGTYNDSEIYAVPDAGIEMTLPMQITAHGPRYALYIVSHTPDVCNIYVEPAPANNVTGLDPTCRTMPSRGARSPILSSETIETVGPGTITLNWPNQYNLTVTVKEEMCEYSCAACTGPLFFRYGGDHYTLDAGGSVKIENNPDATLYVATCAAFYNVGNYSEQTAVDTTIVLAYSCSGVAVDLPDTANTAPVDLTTADTFLPYATTNTRGPRLSAEDLAADTTAYFFSCWHAGATLLSVFKNTSAISDFAPDTNRGSDGIVPTLALSKVPADDYRTGFVYMPQGRPSPTYAFVADEVETPFGHTHERIVTGVGAFTNPLPSAGSIQGRQNGECRVDVTTDVPVQTSVNRWCSFSTLVLKASQGSVENSTCTGQTTEHIVGVESYTSDYMVVHYSAPTELFEVEALYFGNDAVPRVLPVTETTDDAEACAVVAEVDIISPQALLTYDTLDNDLCNSRRYLINNDYMRLVPQYPAGRKPIRVGGVYGTEQVIIGGHQFDRMTSIRMVFNYSTSDAGYSYEGQVLRLDCAYEGSTCGAIAAAGELPIAAATKIVFVPAAGNRVQYIDLSAFTDDYNSATYLFNDDPIYIPIHDDTNSTELYAEVVRTVEIMNPTNNNITITATLLSATTATQAPTSATLNSTDTLNLSEPSCITIRPLDYLTIGNFQNVTFTTNGSTHAARLFALGATPLFLAIGEAAAPVGTLTVEDFGNPSEYESGDALYHLLGNAIIGDVVITDVSVPLFLGVFNSFVASQVVQRAAILCAVPGEDYEFATLGEATPANVTCTPINGSALFEPTDGTYERITYCPAEDTSVTTHRIQYVVPGVSVLGRLALFEIDASIVYDPRYYTLHVEISTNNTASTNIIQGSGQRGLHVPENADSASNYTTKVEVFTTDPVLITVSMQGTSAPAELSATLAEYNDREDYLTAIDLQGDVCITLIDFLSYDTANAVVGHANTVAAKYCLNYTGTVEAAESDGSVIFLSTHCVWDLDIVTGASACLFATAAPGAASVYCNGTFSGDVELQVVVTSKTGTKPCSIGVVSYEAGVDVGGISDTRYLLDAARTVVCTHEQLVVIPITEFNTTFTISIVQPCVMLANLRAGLSYDVFYNTSEMAESGDVDKTGHDTINAVFGAASDIPTSAFYVDNATTTPPTYMSTSASQPWRAATRYDRSAASSADNVTFVFVGNDTSRTHTFSVVAWYLKPPPPPPPPDNFDELSDYGDEFWIFVAACIVVFLCGLFVFVMLCVKAPCKCGRGRRKKVRASSKARA